MGACRLREGPEVELVDGPAMEELVEGSLDRGLGKRVMTVTSVEGDGGAYWVAAGTVATRLTTSTMRDTVRR